LVTKIAIADSETETASFNAHAVSRLEEALHESSRCFQNSLSGNEALQADLDEAKAALLEANTRLSFSEQKFMTEVATSQADTAKREHVEVNLQEAFNDISRKCQDACSRNGTLQAELAETLVKHSHTSQDPETRSEEALTRAIVGMSQQNATAFAGSFLPGASDDKTWKEAVAHTQDMEAHLLATLDETFGGAHEVLSLSGVTGLGEQDGTCSETAVLNDVETISASLQNELKVAEVKLAASEAKASKVEALAAALQSELAMVMDDAEKDVQEAQKEVADQETEIQQMALAYRDLEDEKADAEEKARTTLSELTQSLQKLQDVAYLQVSRSDDY